MNPMSLRLGDTAPNFPIIADADRKVAGPAGVR